MQSGFSVSVNASPQKEQTICDTDRLPSEFFETPVSYRSSLSRLQETFDQAEATLSMSKEWSPTKQWYKKRPREVYRQPKVVDEPDISRDIRTLQMCARGIRHFANDAYTNAKFIRRSMKRIEELSSMS